MCRAWDIFIRIALVLAGFLVGGILERFGPAEAALLLFVVGGLLVVSLIVDEEAKEPMLVIIKLDKEDIITCHYGNNVAITPEEGPIGAIVFSPEAARELAGDLVAVLVLHDRPSFLEECKRKGEEIHQILQAERAGAGPSEEDDDDRG